MKYGSMLVLLLMFVGIILYSCGDKGELVPGTYLKLESVDLNFSQEHSNKPESIFTLHDYLFVLWADDSIDRWKRGSDADGLEFVDSFDNKVVFGTSFKPEMCWSNSDDRMYCTSQTHESDEIAVFRFENGSFSKLCSTVIPSNWRINEWVRDGKIMNEKFVSIDGVAHVFSIDDKCTFSVYPIEGDDVYLPDGEGDNVAGRIKSAAFDARKKLLLVGASKGRLILYRLKDNGSFSYIDTIWNYGSRCRFLNDKYIMVQSGRRFLIVEYSSNWMKRKLMFGIPGYFRPDYTYLLKDLLVFHREHTTEVVVAFDYESLLDSVDIKRMSGEKEDVIVGANVFYAVDSKGVAERYDASKSGIEYVGKGFFGDKIKWPSAYGDYILSECKVYKFKEKDMVSLVGEISEPDFEIEPEPNSWLYRKYCSFFGDTIFAKYYSGDTESKPVIVTYKIESGKIKKKEEFPNCFQDYEDKYDMILIPHFSSLQIGSCVFRLDGNTPKLTDEPPQREDYDKLDHFLDDYDLVQTGFYGEYAVQQEVFSIYMFKQGSEEEKEIIGVLPSVIDNHSYVHINAGSGIILTSSHYMLMVERVPDGFIK